MNLKALSLGAVLGILVAFIPSCGSGTCGPANCNGCCDSTNKCVPSSASSSNTACGTKGATCANCQANNQICNATSFTCEFAAGQGGGSATGGGTGGGSATGGGTGGGSATGGGTGGGTTGGGTGGGTAGCNIAAQTCGAGSSCMYTDNMGNTACFPGACDVVAQNCPTQTDKCSYAGLADGGAGRACGPAGAKTEGQACGPSMDDCAKGLLCVQGTCAKFCYQASNCTAAGAQCIGLITIGGVPEVPATCVTLSGCDPYLQNCPTTQACSLTQSGPACITNGTVPANGTCTPSAGCVRGNLCLVTMQGATSGTCKPFCNLDGGAPTCAGSCTGLQGVPYGVCP
jgi:hypothetical protein